MSRDGQIETMQLEGRRFPPSAEFARQANAQRDIYDLSFDDFWEGEGRERVSWFVPFSGLYVWEPPYARFFLGGKLNVCFNCVDRHVEAGRGSKVAYFWEGEPGGERRVVTYADLLRDVSRFANG
jgi:acetyl-CoA synthetase